jgi:CheY-specific phosphatase CheX
MEQALSRAAGDVLEQMFFAGIVEELSTDQIAEPAIAVRMAFDGERRGVLALRISTGAARTLACDFLGEEADGLEEVQVHEVVKELTNMICGDALSALERTALRLAAPALVPAAEFGVPGTGTYRSFNLGNGGLTVALTFLEDTHG